MKKLYFAIPALALVLASSSSVVLYQTGVAGYTGSPGEQTCHACHSGGAAAVSGISITAVPSFTNGDYHPDSIYQVTVNVSAGSFGNYGFACEILDSANSNAGNMTKAGPGVKFLNAFGRKNAVHSVVKAGQPAAFTFTWAPPTHGTVNFYAIANAVNKNNTTTGDFVIPPVALTLTAIPKPEPVDTATVTSGLSEDLSAGFDLRIGPNPARLYSIINFNSSKQTTAEITISDLNNREVKKYAAREVSQGNSQVVLDVADLPAGMYFVRVKTEEQRAVQKVLLVNH